MVKRREIKVKNIADEAEREAAIERFAGQADGGQVAEKKTLDAGANKTLYKRIGWNEFEDNLIREAAESESVTVAGFIRSAAVARAKDVLGRK